MLNTTQWNLVASAIFSLLVLLLTTSYLNLDQTTPILTKNDVYFNTDTVQYVGKVKDRNYTEINTKHLLRFYTSIPLSRGFEVFFEGTPQERAHKGVMATNFVSLVLVFILFSSVAFRQTQSVRKTWCFNLIHVLASSMMIMLAPDHFAQSYLLTSLLLCLVWYQQGRKNMRYYGLLMLVGVLIAGTTTSNVFFVFLLFLLLVERHLVWLKKYTTIVIYLTCAAPLIGGLAFVLVQSSFDQYNILFLKYFNFRAFYEPLQALYYGLSGMVYPLVSPLPAFNAKGNISLEPLQLGQLLSIYIIPFAAVLYTLFLGAFRSDDRISNNRLSLVALAWLIFNAGFHNIWGDEYILFAPHYLCALMYFLLMAFKSASWRGALLLTALVLPFQLRFVIEVKQLLSSTVM